jgi:rare lipoprotein A
MSCARQTEWVEATLKEEEATDEAQTEIAESPRLSKKPKQLSAGRFLTHNQIRESVMSRCVLFALTVMFFATPAHANLVGASRYGNELRGNRTASGEMFNPNGLTAAHKTLPFGTCLVVGNPTTGKSVAVRVNDRGPFAKGLALDLSAGAARAIGMRSTQSVTMKHC